MLLLYAATLFLSATLLFLVQPMVARMVLPLLGGTPAVWNSCMVFFQAALLLGYGYAHLSTRVLGVRRQALAHLAVLLLPLAVLPIAVPPGFAPPGDAHPVPWVLLLLVRSVGLPFLVVSTSAPLLQRWFSSTRHPAAQDPYFLYGASNLGSLLALLGYPLLLEPRLPLAAQSRLWTAGYGLLCALILGCALWLRRSPPAQAPSPALADAPPPAWSRRLRWVALATAPSSLMLGVTSFISTDIAAIPLLWVVPLALYLLTFILAFGTAAAALTRTATRVLPALVLLVLFLIFFLRMPERIWLFIPLHLLVFFLGALACHGALALDRPPPQHLTEFYIWMSLGGVLGGLFNTLAAPALFHGVIEYPAALVATCLLLPRRTRAYGLGLLAALLVALLSSSMNQFVLARERSFFGALRVVHDPTTNSHKLYHGTTTHGTQSLDPALRGRPLTYYDPTGPIGQVIGALPDRRGDFGLIGLGCGALAAYGEPGQRLTYYEIDPAVTRLARDPRLFTYLRDSRAAVEVVHGDARLRIAEAADGRFALVVVDAFSSDVVPVHLLTREALQLYLRKLAPEGLLAFHISNRYFRLAPVLGDLAAALGLSGWHQNDAQVSEEQQRQGKLSSHWVVIARRPEHLGPLQADPRWRKLPTSPNPRLWTDDFADVLGTLR